MDKASFDLVAGFIVKNKKSVIAFLKKNNIAASSKDTLRNLSEKLYLFAIASKSNASLVQDLINGGKSGFNFVETIGSLISSKGVSADDVVAQGNASLITQGIVKEKTNTWLTVSGLILVVIVIAVSAFLIIKSKKSL